MSFRIDAQTFDPRPRRPGRHPRRRRGAAPGPRQPDGPPFLLHVWPMQVLREGARAGEEVTSRDVVNIPAHGLSVVRIPFDRHTGRTAHHGHILDHDDLGRMGVIDTR